MHAAELGADGRTDAFAGGPLWRYRSEQNVFVFYPGRTRVTSEDAAARNGMMGWTDRLLCTSSAEAGGTAPPPPSGSSRRIPLFSLHPASSVHPLLILSTFVPPTKLYGAAKRDSRHRCSARARNSTDRLRLHCTWNSARKWQCSGI